MLASYAYDDRGRRTSLTHGNGAVTSYGYDNFSRLTQIVQNPSGTSYDLTLDFTRDPAGAIAGTTRSKPGSSPGQADAYAWTGHYAINRNYAANGLNQYTASGSVSPTYGANGNLTSDATSGFEYNAENRLTVGYVGATHQELIDDSLDRLYRYHDGTANDWLTYDGQSLTAEWNAAGSAIARRYVHGPGTDEALVSYDGSGTSDRHWYHADERGSVIAISDGSGAVTDLNSYDEYGIPGASPSSRRSFAG